MSKQDLSPMMQKYLETKEQYKDCILFYRLGDFYEMFFDDALVASKELELTLTGKSCGLDERAPMCGVPFHACDVYINRLVQKGHKVAICEQVEDPKLTKGLVKREVVRVVTPGTNIDMQSLEESRHNYLMCIIYTSNAFGISACDITTGDYFVTEVKELRKLCDEIFRYNPSEIICNEAFLLSGIDLDELKYKLSCCVYPLEAWYFDDEACINALKSHFSVSTLDGLGLKDIDIGAISAGAMMQYLNETQKNSLDQISRIQPYNVSSYMVLDSATRRNLELTETLRDKAKRGSLLWVLDKTNTAMGARMLRSFIEQPLIDKALINERLDIIEAMCNNPMFREELREYLNPIYDLERLVSKICYKSANPRDLIAFKNSVNMLPHIKRLLSDFNDKNIMTLVVNLDTLDDLAELIDAAIDDEPSLMLREGGIIKKGYNDTVDTLRDAKVKGKSWLAELELSDRERTGIKNLKIKYNKVFGYYYEVTNSFIDLVPEDYIRKQTLVNAERYTNEKLKNLEDTILNAEDRLFSLEYDLFSSVRDHLAEEVVRIQNTAHLIALIDAYASLSNVADHNGYVRPKLNEKGIIDIKSGRHPVVEKMLDNGMFVANDTYLDNSTERVSIITGPNMAGKSTYMRQVALIVLMAQIGSFVPATSANIGIVDRIFTRVGASDDLASGQSTFMVEMSEVANILRNATNRSLLILDEIGRGTSTFDGLSIAWAVVEHISNPKLLGAKTLFATHYHELTELEGKLNNVSNYCIAVKEQGDNIVFLRKIVKGGADKSYGIQVAKLAGVPDSVIERASELVERLSMNDISQSFDSLFDNSKTGKKKSIKKLDDVDLMQMSLFDTVRDDDIIKELKELDINRMTPMEALNTLSKFQCMLNNRW